MFGGSIPERDEKDDEKLYNTLTVHDPTGIFSFVIHAWDFFFYIYFLTLATLESISTEGLADIFSAYSGKKFVPYGELKHS